MVAGDAVGEQHPWWVIGAADLAATVVVLLVSRCGEYLPATQRHRCDNAAAREL